MTRQYLSFGGGVNSTALLLELTDRGEEFETVFVNHGGDYPETYEYIEYLRAEGFEITEVIPDYRGCNTLYDYCIKYKIIPTIQFRWCTHYFKIVPYFEYLTPNLPCVSFIGFDADEEKRVERSRNHKYRYKIEHQIKNRFPLFDMGIDRSACVDIIKSHGLNIPPKSGCYFCPFQSKLGYRMLFLKHPNLFKEVVAMEKNMVSKNKIYLRGNKNISEIAMAYTPPLQHYFEKVIK